jgi:hypothetical protein
LAMSVLARPGQVMALFGLARDAAAARRALRARATQISPEGWVADRLLPDELLPDDIASEDILSVGIL